jgi:hypothetical protein
MFPEIGEDKETVLKALSKLSNTLKGSDNSGGG